MKTKFFTLLALCVGLSVGVVKAAFGEWTFAVSGKVPHGYFGAAPSLCSYISVTENGNTFARFTRPTSASLTDGPSWGAVDRTLNLQTQVVSIPGGNVAMGTAKNTTYNEYLIVRMRKISGSGVPQVNFYSLSQSNTIDASSTTPVVLGEWVSYLFDVSNVSGTNYKMFTVIPDKSNVVCVTDISDCTFTNTPFLVSASPNDVNMGTVSGGGVYATGKTALLTATPKTGYRFDSWNENSTVSSTATSYTTTAITTARTITAKFVPGCTITASAVGGTVSGLATNGGYDLNSSVSLTASPTGNNRFIGWVDETGSIISPDLNYTFSATANKTLIAYFAASGTNYTSAAPTALTYIYGTVGVGGIPASGTQGSIAIDYLNSGNVIISLPSNPSFEISTSQNSGYSNGPITLTANGSNNVPYTTIYVHLKEGQAYSSSYTNTLTITPTNGSVATITLTGSVSKKPLFVTGANVVNKIYDKTTPATISASGILTGVIGSDVVSVSSAGTFSDYNVGDLKTVTATLSGANAANYNLTFTSNGRIFPKILTVGVTLKSGYTSKIYDGATTTGVVGTVLSGTTPNASLSSTESAGAGTTSDGKPYETLTYTANTITAATYNSKDVGTAYGVYFTGPTISGTNNTNYIIGTPATITSKPLTMSGLSVPVSKVYDGLTSATVSGAPTLQASETAGTGTTSDGKWYTNDVVSITGTAAGTYNSKDVSSASTVAYSGLSLTGTQAGNYSLTMQSAASATITTAPITITGLSGVNKNYDGTNTASLTGTASYSGLQNSESFTVTGTPSATFANASVANNKSITVTGFTAPSVNYTLTQPTGLTANITAKPLTLPDAAATSKVYDGTNAAVITGTLTGKVGSEDVSYIGTGTFANANVGSPVAVTSTSTLTGTAAGNYSLTQPTGLSANITPLGLTISSPSVSSKSYDGNANITVSGTLLTPIGGDDVSLNTTATVPNANVGTTKPVTFALTGTKASNYSLTQPSPTLTADINAIPLTVSATDLWSNSSNWSSVPNEGTDITVTNGELTIDQNPAVHSITVNSGAKLTLNSGKTLSTGSIILQNEATYVDKNTYTVDNPAPAVNATANQYLGAARNWYISSPISNATAPTGYTYYKYHEAGDNENLNPLYTTAYWENVGSTPTLTNGTGYVANLASGTATYSLSGTLNTGNVPLTLSRSGAVLPGFNLVGNPYPSFLDISSLASNSDLVPTYWVRSKNGSYVFDTYNIPGGMSTGLSGFAVTSKIAPMQAFWLRVKSGSSSASVTFTNAMRTHQDDANNKFRAPSANALTQQVLRLQVSNGIATDETVMYTNSAASNDFDEYDSQKMSNSSASIPEIYTLADGEHLTINGLNSIPYDTELAIGYSTGQTNTFSFKATQFSNFDAGTRIILKDYADANNPVITDLTDGTNYSFTSTATNNNNSRFTLTFKAPSVATGVNPQSKGNVWVSTVNGQIVVNGITNGATLEVFNAVGQKVISKNLTESVIQTNNNLPAGAYLVKVSNEGKSITRKIIIN